MVRNPNYQIDASDYKHKINHQNKRRGNKEKSNSHVERRNEHNKKKNNKPTGNPKQNSKKKNKSHNHSNNSHDEDPDEDPDENPNGYSSTISSSIMSSTIVSFDGRYIPSSKETTLHKRTAQQVSIKWTTTDFETSLINFISHIGQ